MIPEDVPSPIDFHDRAQALGWIERTERDRPYRPLFFRRIAEELAALHRPLSVAELGSGPGLLARHVLESVPAVGSYALIDSSEAMLEISRERLVGTAAKLRFLPLDFRYPDWARAVGVVDAVVSMQAVHELRHKHRARALYEQIASILGPDGVVLVCDHLPGQAADARRSALFMGVAEQIAALGAAGLSPALLLESDGMALYRAVHV